MLLQSETGNFGFDWGDYFEDFNQSFRSQARRFLARSNDYTGTCSFEWLEVNG